MPTPLSHTQTILEDLVWRKTADECGFYQTGIIPLLDIAAAEKEEDRERNCGI